MMRSVLGRIVGLEGLRAWVRGQLKDIRGDVAAAGKCGTAAVAQAKTLRKALEHQEQKSRASTAEVQRHQDQLSEVTVRLARLELLAAANDRMSSLMFRPDPSELAATVQHARLSVQRSVLELEPGPHAVIDNVLPQGV